MKEIRHEGIVVHLEKGKATVMVSRSAACNTCHAKKVCLSSADSKSMNINVNCTDDSMIAIGEHVIIILPVYKGFQAVFIAFLLPLILVVVAILLFSTFINNEITSCLIGIATLLIYWVILRILRFKINNQYPFKIVKKQ